MKALAAVLFASLFTSPIYANTVYCRATVNVPGTTLSGSCRNGNCSLRGNGGYVSGTGTCDDGQTIRISASVPSAYVNASCRNGWLSASLYGGYLRWTGTCSTGGYFDANDSYLGGSQVSGSCQEDGYTSVRSNPDFVSVTATCTIP